MPFSHIELDDDLKEHIAFSAGGGSKGYGVHHGKS